MREAEGNKFGIQISQLESLLVVLIADMIHRESLNEAAHLIRFQGLLKTRVTTSGFLVSVVRRLYHAPISPHIF
jgi:hypothetical protein